MFISIYLYELKYWLKKPSTYLYMLIFSFVAFVYMSENLDFFRDVEASYGLQKWYNSPFNLNDIFSYFNRFFLFLLPAIVGASIYRDFSSDTYKILYSYPIRKRDYFLGKFLGSLTVVFLIAATVGLTFIICEQLPAANPAKLGPFKLSTYLREFFFIGFPNLLVIGALVFAVVSRSRNVFAGFGLIIGLFFFQELVENLFSHSHITMALLDPLAKNTVAYLSLDWDALQRNNNPIPLQGILLQNRLVWLGVGTLFFALAYRSFRLHEHLSPLINWRKGGSRQIKNDFNSHGLIRFPQMTFNFGRSFKWRSWFYLLKDYLGSIFRSPIFYVLLLLAIFSVLSMLYNFMVTREVAVLPATKFVLSFPSMFYKGVMILITFLFSGILIHRERSSKVNELVDILPLSNLNFIVAKFSAIIVMQAVLFLALIIAGVSFQLFAGYHRLQLDLYFYQLFGLEFITLIIWTCLAFLIHSLLKNVYVGFFLLLLIWMGSSNLNLLGIFSHLPAFNKNDLLQYSDMDGYGTALSAYFTLKAYWGSLAVVFSLLTYLVWQRGMGASIKGRWKILSHRWNKLLTIILLLAVSSFAAFGIYIYQEEEKNTFLQPKVMQQNYQDFTLSFLPYASMVQPKIESLKLDLDLYPSENRFAGKGVYLIKNHSAQAIDTLLIRGGFEEDTEFDLNVAFQILKQDSNFNFFMVGLDKALQPGDEIQLSFEMSSRENNLFETFGSVLGNGTLVKEDILLRLGYINDNPLSDPTDPKSKKFHAYARDSDLIEFEATISTSADQKVIAPGKLLKEWTKNARRYFHYQSQQPIKFSLGITSAVYDSLKEDYQGKELSVYYHPGHDNNLESMLLGLKKAMDFNQQHFAPYQHDAARIAEFSQSLGTFATTYANNIPTSEMRFQTSFDHESGDLDMAFYVAAHELSHQWWGNQILPAAAYGSRMLTESITEFISLCILEETYGYEAKQSFLRQQHYRYMRFQKWKKNEKPLYLVGQNDSYLFYGKGSMAFHAIAQRMGKEKLLGILSDFLRAHRFQEAPYPTSLDLIDSLNLNSMEQLKPFIKQWLQETVIYENKIENAALTEKEKGKWEVSFDLELKKKLKTEQGEEEMKELNEYVEFALYQAGKLKKVVNRRVNTSQQTLKLQLDFRPDKIILDPHLLMLDKRLEDNEVGF